MLYLGHFASLRSDFERRPLSEQGHVIALVRPSYVLIGKVLQLAHLALPMAATGDIGYSGYRHWQLSPKICRLKM